MWCSDEANVALIPIRKSDTLPVHISADTNTVVSLAIDRLSLHAYLARQTLDAEIYRNDEEAEMEIKFHVVPFYGSQIVVHLQIAVFDLYCLSRAVSKTYFEKN